MCSRHSIGFTTQYRARPFSKSQSFFSEACNDSGVMLGAKKARGEKSREQNVKLVGDRNSDALINCTFSSLPVMQQSASEKERGRSGQFPKRKYYTNISKENLQKKLISRESCVIGRSLFH